MHSEYQRRFLSNAFEAQRPGDIKGQWTASSICPNATQHLCLFTTARQNSILIPPSMSMSYILVSSSQLRLSSKGPDSFPFSHQNFVYVSLPAHTCKCPIFLIRHAVKYQNRTRSKILEYPLYYCYFLPCKVK